MKKLLLSSAVLTLFSISIAIFQISCQKDATAQTSSYTLPPATTTTLGGVIVGNGLTVTSNGTLSVTSSGAAQLNKIIFTKSNSAIPQKFEIWTANYDGTNQTKLNITMPSGYQCAGDGEVKMSPDGQKIFFTSLQFSNSTTHIFSCNADGTNLTKIVDGSSAGTEGLFLGAAY